MVLAAIVKIIICGWELGPFTRPPGINPIVQPRASLFVFPSESKPSAWESGNTFNPAAAVWKGHVVLLYRAEDDPGRGVGQHRSSIGYGSSGNGISFRTRPNPVLFLDEHNRKYENPGGCEDPRVVSRPGGGYLMTYTAYDRHTARLCVAESKDLIHWVKYGPAFAGPQFQNTWSKSGSIVCKRLGDRLVAAKIRGHYWMYWGEEPIHVAVSSDLIHWAPLEVGNGRLKTLFDRRPGKFDSALVEPGPPAVLTKAGIVFIYNGKNADHGGELALSPGAYSAGEALLDPTHPDRLISRTDYPVIWPEEPFEMTGQYKAGTVFTEGLVPFKGKWYLYFGTADSFVAVATAPLNP